MRIWFMLHSLILRALKRDPMHLSSVCSRISKPIYPSLPRLSLHIVHEWSRTQITFPVMLRTHPIQMQIPTNCTESVPPRRRVDHTSITHNWKYTSPFFCGSRPSREMCSLAIRVSDSSFLLLQALDSHLWGFETHPCLFLWIRYFTMVFTSS